MPIVFNVQTGKAEDLVPEAADKGIAEGTHSIPMVTKEGSFTAISPKDLPGAMQQGYRQPDPTELQSMLDYTEHTTPQAQARAGLRSLGNTLTFGAFDPVMQKIEQETKGTTPEEYRRNAELDAEMNPGTDFMGKVAGIVTPVGPLSAGLGVAGKLGTKLGETIAKSAGIAESAFAAKALQTGLREAAQAALVQSGDEVSKQFTMEPEKSVQQSLTDVGLAGLTGAAFGVGASAANKFVAQPLWKATKESQLGKLVSALRSGAEGVADVESAAARAGVEVPAELRAKMSSNPALRQEAEAVAKSTTRAGQKIRNAEEAFKQNAENEVLTTLGKTAQDIDKPVSLYELGSKVKEEVLGFARKAKSQIDEAYKPSEELLKNEMLPANFVTKVRQDFNGIATKLGYHKSEGLGEAKRINKVLSELEEVKNFDELKTFISRQEKTLKSERLFEFKRVVSNVLRSNQSQARKEVLGLVNPKVLGQLESADALYSSTMKRLSALGERLGVRRMEDVATFIRKLEKSGNEESILRALTTSKDADLVKLLQSEFPEIADAVKQAHLSKIPLEKAEGILNLKKAMNYVNDLSPEVQEFVLGAANADKVRAIDELLSSLGKTKEAKLADSIIGSIPGGVGSLIGIMTGGYPGAMAGYALGKLGKEGQAAVRLAVLKSIAQGGEMSGSGFRAMFEAANAAYRGAARQEKAVASLFKPLTSLVEVISAPSAKSLGLLDKVVVAAQTDPTKLENISGDLAETLPDHSAHLAATSARAMSYLASLRPDTGKPSPLEPERVPSAVEIAKYNRALEIVEQPLTILKHVKDGTITPQDITTISTVYPALYDSMKEQVMDKLVEYSQKDVKLDYATKIGLSLFLGTNLESSTRPNNIMANQAIYAPPMPPQKPGRQAPSALKASKLPNIYSTPEQLREQKRSK
jgi:hypothetical protein